MLFFIPSYIFSSFSRPRKAQKEEEEDLALAYLGHRLNPSWDSPTRLPPNGPAKRSYSHLHTKTKPVQGTRRSLPMERNG